MKLSYLRDNVAIAALLGCFVGIGFMLLLGSGFSDNAVKFGTYGIAILVSLLASGFALVGVFANINNQNKLADQQHQNALTASRAVLPIALTEITTKCRRGIEIRLGHNVEKYSPHQRLEQITITETSLRILQSNVETASSQNAEALSKAIAGYATVVARYRNVNSSCTQDNEKARQGSSHEGLGAAICWAEVLIRFENCADYARGRMEEISTNIDANEIAEVFKSKMDYLDVDPENLKTDLEVWSALFQDRKNSLS